MSANVFSARLYQKECSMATARSKVGWTAAAHEVGKETFPSLPPGASSSWARAARDEASRKDAATARSKVGWTAAAHEVGKETFPSLPPGASSSWARAARDEA